MKILLVHNYYQAPGGEDVVFEGEAELLATHGHEVVRYVRRNAEIDAYGFGRKAGLAVATTWAQDSHAAIKALIARERPDIAHFHNTFPLVSPAAYYACNSAGIPVVQTVHNYRFFCLVSTLQRDGRVCEDCVGRLPWPGVMHRCYRGSAVQSLIVASSLTAHRALRTYKNHVQRYLALTEFGRGLLMRGGFDEKRILVKPNFVGPDPGMRGGNGNYALFVGRLSNEKGVLLLLEAWKALPNVPLHIVGDGALMAEVKARARALPNVRVLGALSRAEVFEQLRDAGVLVFPSEVYEGMGIIIVEAFAVGVPVVASALGAPLELLEHGRLGTLFRPSDAQDLAAAVTKVMKHPERLKSQVQAARAAYETRFTPEVTYAALMNVYAQASEQLRSDSK